MRECPWGPHEGADHPLQLSVILFTAGWFLAGRAPAPDRGMAREYRLVHGVTDAGGVAALEEKLNTRGGAFGGA